MFKRLTIMAAFFILERFLIKKITFAPLQEFFTRLIAPAKAAADILTDANPDNAAQLKEFWEKQEFTLLDTGLEGAKAIIAAKVKDVNIKMALLAILNEIDDSLPGDQATILSIQNHFQKSTLA